MLKRTIFPLLIAISLSILPQVSKVAADSSSETSRDVSVDSDARVASTLLNARHAHLRRGINLSHWFSQSNDYSKTRLDRHTTAEDIALIEKVGFDHVRFPVESAILFNPSNPSALNAEYLGYVDSALDMILSHKGLAVIVDIHPSDEFKVKMNTDNRHVESFAKFWKAFAQHLSARDSERVFLEVINEPMVEDGHRWFGIQAKLIAAIRAGAPRHTIIATGHRWSGLNEFLFLEPYADKNIIYNFHYYEPFTFTHQGANWAGPMWTLYKNVPYPSSPESVTKVLETLQDGQARLNLLHYGESKWNVARLETEIAKAAAWAKEHGVPITCNEFGVYRRFSPPADRVAWIRDMRIVLEKHGIGWAMWDYAGGFAVAIKRDGRATVDNETVKALGLRAQAQ